MAKKLYQYTLLNQDGTREALPPCPKKTFEDFYKMLNCRRIEVIPDSYYKDDWGKSATLYGDEEARFNSENTRNPHTKVLQGDPTIGEPIVWDCVGNLILEQPYKGEAV